MTSIQSQLRPKLVWFSGSGAKIASHLGAAAAMEELGIVPEQYAGCSGGAIIATLAAMGQVRTNVKRILDIRSKDIFRPNILSDKGNVRAGVALAGLLRNKLRGMSRLCIERELLSAKVAGARLYGDLWCVAYVEDEDTVKPFVGHTRYQSGQRYVTPSWAKVLENQASFPLLNVVGNVSDAGLTVQYPTKFISENDSSIYFTIEEDKPLDLFSSMLIRVSKENKRTQKPEKGTCINLPSRNGRLEYNREKMIKSYQLAYAHAREILCQD